MPDPGQTPVNPNPAPGPDRKTYIVEHLDPELGPWSELEYLCVARESRNQGSRFVLSSLPPGFRVPDSLASMEGGPGGHFAAERRGVEFDNLDFTLEMIVDSAGLGFELKVDGVRYGRVEAESH